MGFPWFGKKPGLSTFWILKEMGFLFWLKS